MNTKGYDIIATKIEASKEGISAALSEEIYNIAVEMTEATEALLMPNEKEVQVLTDDAKRLLEISKILKDKGF